jgi:hypothetical protein
VTVAALAVEPARGPELGTGGPGEAPGGLTAIPATQRDFDSGVQSTAFTTFVNIPNSVVTPDNGASTRQVVVTFSADAGVTDAGDFLILAFRLDNSLVCSAGGPVDFTGKTFPAETRTAVHVFSLGPGSHTIRPCWRVAADGDGAQIVSVFSRTPDRGRTDQVAATSGCCRRNPLFAGSWRRN